MHRSRRGFVEEHTASYKRLRDLMAEFGIVLPQKLARLRREIGARLEVLHGCANPCIGELLTQSDQLEKRIEDEDRIIAQAARQAGQRPERTMAKLSAGRFATATLRSIDDRSG